MVKIKPILIFGLWSVFLFALSVAIVILINYFYSDNTNFKVDGMLKLDIPMLEVLVLFVLLQLGFTVALMMWGHRIKWMRDMVGHTGRSRRHRRPVHRFSTGTRINFTRSNQVQTRPVRAQPALPVAPSVDSAHTYESVSENDHVIVHRTIDSPDNTGERNNQIDSAIDATTQAKELQIGQKNKKTNNLTNVKIQMELPEIAHNTKQTGTAVNVAFKTGSSSKCLKKSDINGENNFKIQAHSSGLRIQSNIGKNSSNKFNDFNVININETKNGLSYSIHFPKLTKPVKKTSPVYTKVSQKIISTSKASPSTHETHKNKVGINKTGRYVRKPTLREIKSKTGQDSSKLGKCIYRTYTVRKIPTRTNIFTNLGRFPQQNVKEQDNSACEKKNLSTIIEE